MTGIVVCGVAGLLMALAGVVIELRATRTARPAEPRPDPMAGSGAQLLALYEQARTDEQFRRIIAADVVAEAQRRSRERHGPGWCDCTRDPATGVRHDVTGMRCPYRSWR